jgi:histidinol-phosphate aminotransferase
MINRRSFIATLGASGAGLLAAPAIAWRGREALFGQGAAARRADRLLAAQPGMIRIDSNENPNGPGERVFAVIRAHLAESNRYPVKSEDDLVAAIARIHKVRPENIVLGCGSGELLRAAVSACTARDRVLVSPEPTFEGPAAWAKFIGTPVVAPEVDAALRLDLDAMITAAHGAGLVYLCNPNNPTATMHSLADVTSYVDRVGTESPETTILVDEAYFEYVDEPSYGTAIPLALANPRVVVTRTFSKVFGMAGLRVGYAAGQPATLAKLSAWLLGSNVSQLSLVAAAATIGDAPHIAVEQRRNRATRATTRRFFEQAGFTVAECQANFMMVDIRRDAKQFKLDCLKQKVAVGRQFASLPTWVRVSVGTPEEMRKALQVFRATLV